MILIVSNLFSSKDIIAGGPTRYSIANGEWSSSIWSNSNSGPSCGCNPGCNYDGSGIEIKHKVISSSCSSLEYSGGGTMSITGNGRLIVNSSFTISNGSTLNIASNDTVIIHGNFNVTGGSTVNIDGYLRVNGNVTLSGGSFVCGTGLATYSGILSGTTWCLAPLPIELLNFHARSEGNKVKLSWTTASESNNDYFSIERSVDGKLFKEIHRVTGAGNSSIPLTYSIIDYNPSKGQNYYRLKQTDFNGRFSFSKLVYVVNGVGSIKDDFIIESISPNPFSDNFSVYYRLASPSEVIIKIQSSAGKIVHQVTNQADEGLNVYHYIDIKKLVPGIYFLSIEAHGKVMTKKVMKL